MRFDVEWLLLALAPVFLLCIGWEAWYLARTRPQDHVYAWRDTLCNAALALMHQGADKLAWVFVIPVYAYCYDRYRLFTWHDGWLSFAVLFVAQDFLYYVFHRASHRVRWLWAAHVVHHSSERMNFSTAFRQSLMYPVAGMWVFWLPLAVLGFPPQQIVGIVLINLAFQFFVHTQAIGKLGWLEYVFNTPSIHRAHHARNARYIDRNYAGVLVIWDRLFGSYVDEATDDPPQYGIVERLESNNPLVATFHEWRAMVADALRVEGWRNKLRAIVGPPEWASAYHAQIGDTADRDPRRAPLAGVHNE
ncbi:MULTISPECIES: sterol desaturase family protein [Burkholderia]|uniref:Sterol desaturase family protein n=2 Tax=Burkholderia multivorans TaxID=87883 RepID=B9BTI6_9BURK|nr:MULTISPECIES: sterol desaturase family protein [Burkholderia]AJY18530.1 fatty acid hydroxylase superfamily protein [Burkholderia multivorans ATCC BAA-247]AVR23061.1 sterol desaturase family protein [Burkholderia multivorans]EEE05754.1 sterol desaturase family protein [Burkholderia multivorans CGD2]EEE12826.1 sterol desaturase family protein [Burkholderia multivorans CGD2M]EJO54206.1 fatty acid hydroxylase family protein [Burkholderia multivorans ATCC BAA-247]